MEIGTQVTIIPRNMNLSCCNTVDKAISVMSKNIEPESVMPLCIRVKYYSRAPGKVSTSHKVKNHVESESWNTL